MAPLLGSSVVYLSALRRRAFGPLPHGLPGVIWTLLWSKLFFKETITRYKIAGLGLIVVGVVLVGLGTAR